MRFIGNLDCELKDVSKDFTLEPFAKDFQPVIEETLRHHKKLPQRKSPLSPLLTVWLVLCLPLRRDLSYPNVLSWLLSGLRRRFPGLSRKPLADGAITHARARIGKEVFRDLFFATARKAATVAADFHGLVSVIIDGSLLTAPDTPQNALEWGKPTASKYRGTAGFPQLRLVALLSAGCHSILDAVIGPSRGTGTGEVTVTRQLIERNAREGLLFLFDRGFWCFDLLDEILQRGAHFLIRVPSHAKLSPIQGSRQKDGSFLARMRDGKKKAGHTVRVVRYQFPGFRSCRIVTSLLDETISAMDLVRHYHVRWEIELAYAAIKVRQCARRTGQCPTVLRSKRPDFAEQEVYALLTMYNLVRSLIKEAATAHHGGDALAISFVDALRAILEAIPAMRGARAELLPDLYQVLLRDVAECVLDRRRRPRVYRRAVKVQRSKFPLKRWNDREIRRDFEAEVRIQRATA